MPTPDVPRDPTDALAAQFDSALRAANATLVGSAEAWHAMFRAYVEVSEAARHAFGGMLIDWHQRLLGRVNR